MMDMDIDPEIDQSMNMDERNVVSGNEHQSSMTAKESFVQSTIQFKNADWRRRRIGKQIQRNK